ncbi:hypothetical protein PghCCS26_62750 [Paenibacillus glycanilyticus]|uniref:CopG-like ribbon-helix-helix domain-containing protein n=1 Tax=Paenibacillus glycanilyticus TaxID=126569 RepID=A0ABQ6NVN4_9BACL|nr:hypothetical protein [Paenibacillus glycanilyticus]GMK49145.1 hypothetical protein PghCCS26_62750 [Paenibacillus glycanilyticus]
MVLKDDNWRVYTTLSKDLIEKIDRDAAKEERTRSKQVAKIVKDYYANKKESE